MAVHVRREPAHRDKKHENPFSMRTFAELARKPIFRLFCETAEKAVVDSTERDYLRFD